MDKSGGVLDAVQGRLLGAKLDALRFDCHSGTSLLLSVTSAKAVDHSIVRDMYVHG